MTESSLSFILDENSDFTMVLEKYFKKLDANQSPSYRLTKFLLRKLRSENNSGFIKILDTYCTDDRRKRLVALIAKHKDLAEKDKREKIEDARRDFATKHPDWHALNECLGGNEERRVTDSLAAAEFLYFLNFRSDQIKEMDKIAQDLFALSKLFGAFSRDYKILEVYFRFFQDNKDKKDELIKEMIKYLRSIYLKPGRYSNEEIQSFNKIILEQADQKTFESQFQKTFAGLDPEEFELAGNFDKFHSSLAICGLVCENLAMIQKRINLKNDCLDKFWSDLDGLPYMLAKIERALSVSNTLIVKNVVETDTKKREKENSIKLLILLMPILKYAIDSSKFKTFSQDKLKKWAANAKKYNGCLEEFKKTDKQAHALFINYLDKM